MATLLAYTAFQVVANAAYTLEAAFFGIAAAGARVLQFVTFGDVSKAFAASVDANLTKASQALDQVKSIEQIQQGIVQALETAGTEANANVQQQQQRAAVVGTASLGGSGGSLGTAELGNLTQANLDPAPSAGAVDGGRYCCPWVKNFDRSSSSGTADTAPRLCGSIPKALKPSTTRFQAPSRTMVAGCR